MKQPNAELVAKAWIQGIPGIPANGVATTLPEDLTTWKAGFVQVEALPGGGPQLHVKKRESVMDVGCWYQPNPGSDKPPWNKASQLAEIVFDGGYAPPLTVQRTLVLPAAYDNARVLSAMPSEPERRGSDAIGNALYGLILELHWIAVPK